MKNTLFRGIAILILTAQPAAAGAIYTCTDSNGRTVYSQNNGKHCRKAEIGNIGLYSNAPVKGRQFSNDTPPQPEAALPPVSEEDHTQRQAAQQELDAAQKALAEGKKIRYGHERNYARYQERIQKLEEAVQKAQNKLNGSNGTHNRHSSARPSPH